MSLGFSRAYASVANVVLFDHVAFGGGGHVRLATLPQLTLNPGDSVVTDSFLSFTVDRYEGDARVGISLRRDAYLPLLIMMAVVLAAPLAARRKVIGLAVGSLVMWAWTLAGVYLLVLWSFVFSLHGVMQISPGASQVVDLAFRTLLLPPGNRFVEPIVVGLALVWWLGAPRAVASVQPPVIGGEATISG